jgi:hypothetical protein
MRQVALLTTAVSLMAFLAMPAWAQFYGQDMHSFSKSRESGVDPLTQYSFGGARFDNTLQFLQRKDEEERKRREQRERQRRMRENDFTNVTEPLMDSYFSRRSYNRR